MVCPSCGAQTEGQGKFCASCGSRLPEVAAQPPAWSQSAVPPPPPAPPGYGAQYGTPPQYGGPQYGAPPYGAPPPQYGGPQYGTPQYGAPPPQPYGAPQYGGAPWSAPAAAAGSSPSIAGLLALAGGVAAIVSAWLPSATGFGTSTGLIDATDTKTLACGYYLLIGGAVAAACGLMLLRRAVGPSSTRALFGLGAIAGGILAVAVEVVTYGQVKDAIDMMNAFGSSEGVSYGIGLFVGAGAGAVSAVGGLMGLLGRR